MVHLILRVARVSWLVLSADLLAFVWVFLWFGSSDALCALGKRSERQSLLGIVVKANMMVPDLLDLRCGLNNIAFVFCWFLTWFLLSFSWLQLSLCRLWLGGCEFSMSFAQPFLLLSSLVSSLQLWVTFWFVPFLSRGFVLSVLVLVF